VSAELSVPLATVCRVLEAPRSTIYARRIQTTGSVVVSKRGPKTEISDDELVELIRAVIAESPFAGEGHRKVRARLRREHDVRVGRHRVLRLTRREGLLASPASRIGRLVRCISDVDPHPFRSGRRCWRGRAPYFVRHVGGRELTHIEGLSALLGSRLLTDTGWTGTSRASVHRGVRGSGTPLREEAGT